MYSASLGTTVVTQAAGEVAAGPGLHFLELQGGQLGRHPCLGSLVCLVCLVCWRPSGPTGMCCCSC